MPVGFRSAFSPTAMIARQPEAPRSHARYRRANGAAEACDAAADFLRLEPNSRGRFACARTARIRSRRPPSCTRWGAQPPNRLRPAPRRRTTSTCRAPASTPPLREWRPLASMRFDTHGRVLLACAATTLSDGFVPGQRDRVGVRQLRRAGEIHGSGSKPTPCRVEDCCTAEKDRRTLH
jgi:hypothetical protein